MLQHKWLCSLILAPLSIGFLGGCETLGLDDVGGSDNERDRYTYRDRDVDYGRRDNDGWVAQRYPNRNDRYDDDRPNDRVYRDNTPVYRDNDRYGRTNDRYDDRGNERLGVDDQRGPNGGAVSAGIPRDAGLVRTESDANSTVLSYRAPHPGKLYVYDRRGQRLIWSGNLRDGDVFSFSLVDNRGALNGRNIFDARGRDRATDVQFYFDVRR